MKLTDRFKPIGGVYIITNLINKKVYVGESSNMYNRIGTHRGKRDQIIHSAIQKYGINNFEVYVEYLPDFSKQDRWDLEEELIKKFDCIAPKGYNICSRGRGVTGFRFSEESKEKMRMNSGTKGKFGSESPSSKPVYVYNINGEYITEFIGYAEAGRKLGISHSDISNVVNGKLQQCKDLIFKKEYMGKSIPPLNNKDKRLRRRKVASYNPLTNEIIQIYQSVSEVGRVLPITRQAIRHAIKKSSISCGYYWKYMN